MFILSLSALFVNEKSLKKLSPDLKVERLARFGHPAYIERVNQARKVSGSDNAILNSFDRQVFLYRIEYSRLCW
jgi:hypothetical protein